PAVLARTGVHGVGIVRWGHGAFGWRGWRTGKIPASRDPVPARIRATAVRRLIPMSVSLSSTPRFGQEVRATATLALPLVLGHVSTGLIGFVDNVIAGHHATATLAAVTVGTALLWLPMMVPIGTLISLTASVSQLDGARRRDEI